jgi:DnaK suppressor protein
VADVGDEDPEVQAPRVALTAFGPLLVARRQALTAQLGDLRRELAELVEATRDANVDDEHDPEGATIAFERSQLILMTTRAEDELSQVEAALVRLSAGRYGRCERCGAAIDDQRLAARPTTRLCIACARA